MKRSLGLLTFDLDDTLYPIAPVIDEANAAFARAMNRFGFDKIQPQDIVVACQQIRQIMSERDPAYAASLSHTEIRELAIRKEMEDVIFQRKLQATADDWATAVSSLSPVVVSHARKYVFDPWSSLSLSFSLYYMIIYIYKTGCVCVCV
jgi:FMN phosphatase YigB (HAD superfamily)